MSDWIDMTHVSYWRGNFFIVVFDKVVDLFVGGIASGNEMVFVEVGVVGSSCVQKHLPNPLKLYLGNFMKLWTCLAAVRIIYQ